MLTLSCVHDKIIIKDIGVEGAQNLQQKLSHKTEILKLFLTVKHKGELKKRLDGRGEKQAKLRLKRYGYEQKQKNKFDFGRGGQSKWLQVKKEYDIINSSFKRK